MAPIPPVTSASSGTRKGERWAGFRLVPDPAPRRFPAFLPGEPTGSDLAPSSGDAGSLDLSCWPRMVEAIEPQETDVMPRAAIAGGQVGDDLAYH